MPDRADAKQVDSWKSIVFKLSFSAWAGGTPICYFFLSFRNLAQWQTWTIVIIALLTALIYGYFIARKMKPSGRIKNCSQMIIPNFVALISGFLVIINPSIGFHVEELLRKHCYAGDFQYSGIEASIDENIQDLVAKKIFNKKQIAIAEGKGIDRDFLIGCWFTLSAPQQPSQKSYTKVIEIKIKHNKYGRIWDLIYPVYLLTRDFKSEVKNFYYDVDGVKKYGYKLHITCINAGQTLKILLVLGRREDSVLSPETWKNAISIRFSDE